MTNNDEKLEKMIFDFCKNDTEVPPYIDKAVRDGLDKCKNAPSKISKTFGLKRIAVILICFGLLATGGVFAINYIVSLFTNSTPGIDSATQNGFVHNIDMDFVYDSNIGIKVGNIVMSTNTLDISFVYDCTDYNDISKINIYEYSITDENGNLIAKVNEPKIDEESIANDFVNVEENINNSNYYNNSVLFKSREFPNLEKLFFNISSLQINSKDENYYINGNWNFEISLNDELGSESINLTNSNISEYVKSVESYLNETTFVVDLELTEKLDKSIGYDLNNILLIDDENNVYYYDFFNFSENKLHLEFYYGKYNLDGELSLQIKIPNGETINLILN